MNKGESGGPIKTHCNLTGVGEGRGGGSTQASMMMRLQGGGGESTNQQETSRKGRNKVMHVIGKYGFIHNRKPPALKKDGTMGGGNITLPEKSARWVERGDLR